eukprot:2295196-Heterocapsa_arctica.AAC.1
MVIGRMPEDRSKTFKTFKDLQTPPKPYPPVCVHLQGPLITANENERGGQGVFLAAGRLPQKTATDAEWRGG